MIEFFSEHGPYVLEGISYSFLLLFLALTIAFPLGLIVCLLGISRRRFGRMLARSFIECIRAMPGILLLFVLYYGLTNIGITLSAISATALTLGLLGSVQVAEIFRGALDGIPQHQRDAGLSLGLTEWQVFRLIVAPQALRIATPALISVAVFTLKDSAMGLLVAIPEVMYRAHDVGSRSFRSMEAFTIAMGTYMALCIPLSLVGRILELKFSQPAHSSVVHSNSTFGKVNLLHQKLRHWNSSSR